MVFQLGYSIEWFVKETLARHVIVFFLQLYSYEALLPIPPYFPPSLHF